MVRRLVFVVVIVVFILIAGLGIKSCSSNRHKDALREYNQQVSGIATDSRQTGQQFFDQLAQGGSQSPQDLQSGISSFRAHAETTLKQAQALSTPSEMAQAQQSLLIALELRRDGLEAIAGQIRTALGDQGDQATNAITSIAAQMRDFDASDVLYSARVVPFIQQALNDNGVPGQVVAQSQFLREISWLSPAYVAGKLGQQLTGSSTSGGSTGTQTTGPGLHGTGLNATSYGNVTLQPGATNRLTYAAGQAFSVAFTNQGDNDEFNVKVALVIARASDGKAVVTINKTVPRIAKGEKSTVQLPLTRTPPTDTSLTVKVIVAAVPGEKQKDNNTSDYPTLFVAG